MGVRVMGDNVNCMFAKRDRCAHPAAPRKLFRLPECLLVYPLEDSRITSGCCALMAPYQRPVVCVTPPPKKP